MSLEYVHALQRYVRKCLPQCFQRAYNMTIFGLNLKSELNLGLSTSESNQFIFQSLNLVKFTHVICKISCLQTFTAADPGFGEGGFVPSPSLPSLPLPSPPLPFPPIPLSSLFPPLPSLPFPIPSPSLPFPSLPSP